MDVQKLTDKELNDLHFDLSKLSFEISSKKGCLNQFYDIERKMQCLRNEFKRRKESTKQIFRMYNFKLLCQIMDKDFGVIECSSISDPNSKVFNKKIKSDEKA
jgi:hypothetical protein